jgi:hypothetical protein
LGRWGRRRFQPHAADVEVFLETIRLQEVGKFEGADIAAALPDFALQISHDPAQVRQREARPQPFVPLPLPVKAQAQTLTGQLAVELVGSSDLFWEVGRHIHPQASLAGVAASSPGTQGTCANAT